MSTKVGKVISVNFDVQAEKNGGGTYPAWQLIFSAANGKVESIVKHMNSLKFTPGLRSSLEGLGVGDDVTVTFEKKGAFNEVTAITKGVVDTPSISTPTGTTKVVGSNYETKEERAARQRLIVRQSSVTAAIGIMGLGAGEAGELNEVLDMADTITNWVFEVKPDKEVE